MSPAGVVMVPSHFIEAGHFLNMSISGPGLGISILAAGGAFSGGLAGSALAGVALSAGFLSSLARASELTPSTATTIATVSFFIISAPPGADISENAAPL